MNQCAPFVNLMFIKIENPLTTLMLLSDMIPDEFRVCMLTNQVSPTEFAYSLGSVMQHRHLKFAEQYAAVVRAKLDSVKVAGASLPRKKQVAQLDDALAYAGILQIYSEAVKFHRAIMDTIDGAEVQTAAVQHGVSADALTEYLNS